MTTQTPVQVELDKLTPAHLDNVKRVYAVMADLLDENTDFNQMEYKDLIVLQGNLEDIQVRDGVLHYFANTPQQMRIDAMRGLTNYIGAAAGHGISAESIGNTTVVLAGFMYTHAGIKFQATDESVEEELDLVDQLLDEATNLGSELSLLGLMKTARRFNVPDDTFYRSIDAVSFQLVTQPVAEREE